MKDDLGNRLKSNYENRTRHYLPRRTYTLVRIDGKAFHSYTKNCEKPFDTGLMADMDSTAIDLCQEMQGAQFAFVQSDEISVLLTDFEGIKTEAWFDGNLQKIASVSASIATRAFNAARIQRAMAYGEFNYEMLSSGACFDSRVFTVPDPEEVANEFLWRQQDASRNSIQMLARSLYSHKECENKNTSQLQEMCFTRGHNWDKLETGKKRGRIVRKDVYKSAIPGTTPADFVERSYWVIDQGIPVFSQDRKYLQDLIPLLPGYQRVQCG